MSAQSRPLPVVDTGVRKTKYAQFNTLKNYGRVGMLALSIAAGATLAASPAGAAVTSVTSSSTVLDVALSALGIPIDLGPLVPASGSAPPAYSVANSLASLSTSIGGLTVRTGLLSDTASGDTAAGTGSASSSLASLAISYAGLFSLSASAIESSSSVDGSPSAVGSSTIASLTITVLGNTIAIPINPTPNDVIFDALGVKVTLNQQIPDALESAGITTNAIAIDVTGLVSGHVDIGQSFASIVGSSSAVPEPSTWAMMLVGFAGLGFAGYRKAARRSAVTA
jgi:PEP-CTERM motif